MARTNRTARNRNVSRAGTRHLSRDIARQLNHMPDAELYALSESADREVARLAGQIAHRRAEALAASK